MIEICFTRFADGTFRLTRIVEMGEFSFLTALAETPFGAFHAAMREQAVSLTSDEIGYITALAKQRADRER